MKYLLHLRDVVQSSLNGVEHGLVVIESLLKWDKGPRDQPTDDGTASTKLDLCFNAMGLDLVFLQGQLNGVLNDIEKDEGLLRNRFQLAQDSRLFRLTVFAGIFLPLSFTTSIFGMNINSDTPDGPRGFSDWTIESLNGLVPETRNMTEILASTALTSQTLSYSWTTFAITSACLLMTLPFSLAIGDIVRTLIVTPSAVSWRGVPIFGVLALAWPLIFFVVGSSMATTFFSTTTFFKTT
jgi:hypothetical protein